MTVAIMDLGTNTFHLLIARSDKKGIKVLYKSKVAVKLGEDGITSGFIGDRAFRRGIKAMTGFSSKIEKYKPAEIVAVGTAAIRNASNKSVFLKTIERETGIRVKVIHGMHEAGLIYEGVKQAIPLNADKMLIMDIGGGSVEFIIADKKKIYWKRSFELGAALLLEKFKPADPLTNRQFQEITAYLNLELAPLLEAANEFQPATLIGSSGSFDTFAALIAHQFYKPTLLKNKTAYAFKMEDYQAIYRNLLFSTTAERNKMKGLVSMRVDMIVIAAIILTFVLDKTKISKMHLSTYALKEGVLSRLINRKNI